MTPASERAASLSTGRRLAITLCLILLLGSLATRVCLADMNPAKPMQPKPYVPRTPKIIRLSHVPASHGIAGPAAARPRGASAKHTSIAAREAWQKRLSNRFSQASQAGTVSTLLPQN
ncbi:MAG TPA: hypothetical protein VHU83_17740 [Bryobacteraceae bacterium]|nr:hypothetical protein [Bryobacteraceae bacterium]